MADKVTAEMVKRACMTLVSTADMQGGYCNVYRCLEFPELTKIRSGPKGRYPKKPAPPTVTLQVNGVQVERNLQAIADAINACREASERGE